MPIRILSDMHRGFGAPWTPSLPPSADVAVVAGDVRKRIGEVPAWLGRTIRRHARVVCVTGNHGRHRACLPDALARTLLGRMRIVRFPAPGPEDLDAPLPGVLADIAAGAGLDPSFPPPLGGIGRPTPGNRWRGGSLRQLRLGVDAVLRAWACASTDRRLL